MSTTAHAPRYEGPYYLTDGQREVRFALLGERASVWDAQGERETTREAAREIFAQLVRLGFRKFTPKSAPYVAPPLGMAGNWTGD